MILFNSSIKKASSIINSEYFKRFLSLLIVTLSFYFLWEIVLAFQVRLFYPFELEWLEGEMIRQMFWVRSGNPLYLPPNLDFIPFIYQPLYTYLGAFFPGFENHPFLVPRFISVFAILGSVILAIRYLGNIRAFGISYFIFLLLFLASYSRSGAYWDLARVDSLFLFFLGFAFLIDKGKPAYLVMAALSLVFAFFTKQIAALAFPFFFLPILFERNLIRIFLGVGLPGILVILGLIALDQCFGPWYYYYVFELPASHILLKERYFSFFSKDLGLVYLSCLVLSIPALFVLWKRGEKRSVDLISFLVVTFVISYLSRLHSGGYYNVLIPIFFGISLAFSCIFTQKSCYLPTVYRQWNDLLFISILLACLIFLPFLDFSLSKHLPGNEDSKKLQILVRKLQDDPGKIWIPYHPYLSVLAGKDGFAHHMALMDVIRAKPGTVRDVFVQTSLRRLSNQEFELVLLDTPRWVFGRDFYDYYKLNWDHPFKEFLGELPSGARLGKIYVYTPK